MNCKFLRSPIKVFIFVFGIVVIGLSFLAYNKSQRVMAAEDNDDKDFIKYAEFNVTYNALEKAMKYDIDSHEDEIKINWIEILSYLGAKYGGDFKSYKESDMADVVDRLKKGESIDEITKNMKYYSYYNKVYNAVLSGMVGEYKIQSGKAEGSQDMVWEEKYGLKAFSPIAKTFPYSHGDDFGNSRSYGYKRRHLGHDMMAATGSPVVAVESGVVEVMGWNQYGGWRIGIRSFDHLRYYYYAHLRQNRPYHADISEGKVVKAGDVIGYVGRTGYSKTENVNNIQESHLHIGLELVFDESQKESDNEIWVDFYNIAQLLEKNRSPVVRNSETKEFYREVDFSESCLEQ